VSADKLPFLPFYGVDFYDDEAVSLMTLEEEAIYLRLLWRQWREGSLPGDPADLEKLARGKPGVTPDSPAVTPRVLACLPLHEDGRRRNPKLETVRTKHLAVRERQASGGRFGRAKQMEARKLGDTPRSPRSKSRVTPGSAQGRLGESESESETDKSISSSTGTDPNNKEIAGAPAPPTQGHWVRRFYTAYLGSIGDVDVGRIGRGLKRLVAEYGQDRVFTAWGYYIRLAPYTRYGEVTEKRDTRFMGVEDFAKNFATWDAKAQPATLPLPTPNGAHRAPATH
jgi:hypothetical protein